MGPGDGRSRTMRVGHSNPLNESRQLSIPPPTPFGGVGSMLGEVPRYDCKGRVVVSQTRNVVRQLIYHEKTQKRTRSL